MYISFTNKHYHIFSKKYKMPSCLLILCCLLPICSPFPPFLSFSNLYLPLILSPSYCCCSTPFCCCCYFSPKWIPWGALCSGFSGMGLCPPNPRRMSSHWWKSNILNLINWTNYSTCWSFLFCFYKQVLPSYLPLASPVRPKCKA